MQNVMETGDGCQKNPIRAEVLADEVRQEVEVVGSVRAKAVGELCGHLGQVGLIPVWPETIERRRENDLKGWP